MSVGAQTPSYAGVLWKHCSAPPIHINTMTSVFDCTTVSYGAAAAAAALGGGHLYRLPWRTQPNMKAAVITLLGLLNHVLRHGPCCIKLLDRITRTVH